MAFFSLLLAGLPSGVEAHWKIDTAVRKWKVLDTVRFRVHYPEGFEETALAAAVYSEQAADRCQTVLEHRLRRVVPIFIFASQQDFSSSNIFPGILGEGTGGFTDFLRRRVVVPFTGDYDQLRHVLTHEIAHAYQFDILRDGNYGRYPLWLMEGMAEYIALGWDVSGETFVRDSVLHGRFPSLGRLHSGKVPGFAFYKAGQAVSYFIADQFGEEYIGRLLKDLRVYRRIDHAIEATFHLRAEQFDQKMHRWVRSRYSKALSSDVADPRMRDVTLRYRTGKGFNIRPTISPDGRHIVYLTSDRIFPALAVRPTPGPDVERRLVEEERIVVRALRSSRYEEWHPLSVRLSFTPDGKEVVLSARDHGRQAIVWVSIRSGNIIRSLTPPFDSIQYPALSPDGESVLFTGVTRGRADLYLLAVRTGRLRRLTADSAHESDPAFSRGGGYAYYAAGPLANDAGTGGRRIYRQALRGNSGAVLLTEIPGNCDAPMPALDGTLIVRCDFTGVANLYRLSNAIRRTTPVRQAELLPITRSPTGIAGASMRVVTDERGSAELIALCEYEEGAFEVRVLPGKFEAAAKGQVAPVDLLLVASRTFDPSGYENPTAGWPLTVPFQPQHVDLKYRPSLSFEGAPFILIAGTSRSSGGSSLAAFAFAQMADDTGDHRLRTFLNYQDSPTTVNADVQYLYLKYRADFFVGAYSQSGTFPISNFLDFSFNNILYNPNFRLLDQRSTGLYGGVDYPLHRFAAFTAALEQGRDEKIFRQAEAEERSQDDIYKNFTQASVAYRYDNSVYSIFGPLDGTSVLLTYSAPANTGVHSREIYTSSAQYRFYHLFENYGVFAFRLFGGVVSGRDAGDYPYRIGGFYTLRGYDFLEFEGTHAVLTNLEYRFPFVDDLRIAFPGDWSIGTVRGVFFFDAGTAFDEPRLFQGYDAGVGVTRDLHLSFGLGIHWVNFLFPIIPGSIMKIEWATPYDTKRALPLSKWRGQFSLGFSFD